MGNTPGMDILTAGEEFVPEVGCGCEGWRLGEAPLWRILTTQKEMFLCPLLCWGWV